MVEDFKKEEIEKKDVIVTGRVYKRYKDYIKKEKINISLLIMKTLDNMNPELKKKK